MNPPRYCCRLHTPPFRARLAREIRRNWRNHLGNAAARGLLLSGLLLAMWGR